MIIELGFASEATKGQAPQGVAELSNNGSPCIRPSTTGFGLEVCITDL